MATLQLDERSGRWRIRFYFGGKEYKRSLKTRLEKQAEIMRQRVEDTLMFLEQGRLEIPVGADPIHFILSDGKRNRKVVVPKVLTLSNLFATYRETFTDGAKEKNTRRVEDIHAKHLERVLGSRTVLASVTTADLQRYVDSRIKERWRGKQIKPQTVKKEIDTLQAVWSWARRLNHVVGAAPTAGITYPRQKEKPPFQTWAEIERAITRGGLTAVETRELWDAVFLSQVEVSDLLEFVRQNSKTTWLYPLFVFAAHTGVRKSEMLRSQVDDFKFDVGMVIIREKKRKKGRETTRRVELSPLLQDVMKRYFCELHMGGRFTLCRKPNEPLLESTVHEAFRWLLRKSKWKVLRGLHVLRHSFASNLAAGGIDQRIIDEFMGHQTEAMRRRYRHLFPEQRRSAINSVYGRSDGTTTLANVHSPASNLVDKTFLQQDSLRA